MNVINQLEYLPDFSDSEKVLAKYILEHGEKILTMSTQDLAKATYTSPATVVRLCKKIGLKGYNDFKIQYSAELQFNLKHNDLTDVNFPFKEGDSIKAIAHSLANIKKEAIDETHSLVDEKEVRKIVDAMLQARNISIYAISFPLVDALDFQRKLAYIGLKVETCLLEGEQVYQAMNSNNEDVAIILSYSGMTDTMCDIAKILKKRKTKIISITCVNENDLSKIADYHLYLSSRENWKTKIGTFASTASFHYVLDLLYCGIFERNYQRNLAYKLDADKELNN